MTTHAPSTQNSATSTAPASTFKPRMRKLSEFVYLVESSSRPGTGHKVDIAAGRCSCTAGQFNKRCHHLALAEQFDRGVQALRAQADQQRRVARAAAPVAGIDAQIVEAERRLTSAHRALADTDEQADEYALLLRQVQQAERAYAALDSRAMRAA
jgi:hypothetical protein